MNIIIIINYRKGGNCDALHVKRLPDVAPVFICFNCEVDNAPK